MATTLSPSELACFHLVRHVLRTHPELTDTQITWGANYICSFYAYSQEALVLAPGPGARLTSEQLIQFLVYADQTGISRFALILNLALDQFLQNQNQTELNQLLLGPKEMFIELYNNPFLEEADQDYLIRLLSRETFTMTLLFERVKNGIINLEAIDDRCLIQEYEASLVPTETGIQVTTLATRCYDEVCLKDAQILSDDPARAIMSQHEKVPESVYTVDKSPNQATPQVFCFKTMELIAAVTNPVLINPKTGAPFSDYALQLINQRFRKEIAMYQRYKQIMDIP